MLGTPDASKYPGIVDLPDWKEGKFEPSAGEKMNKIVPKLDPVGIDLLEVEKKNFFYENFVFFYLNS